MELIREKYLSKIRPHYNVDLIKVITGVRRCGKSVILNQIKDELICKGVNPSHIIYINFEDFEYETINNAAKLNEYIKQFIVDKEKYYIFLDEIQHVNDFERAIASFKATLNTSIFVTGSNSALLSGDLATLLTGRTVEIEIMPFMFSEVKEYFDINNKIFSEEMFYDYLKWGGLPVRFEYNEENTMFMYIHSLYEGIVNKDIIGKVNKINNYAFNQISKYIMSNAGMDFSAENIANYFNKSIIKNDGKHALSNKNTISSRTIYSYLDKMEKAYLIHTTQKFYLSGKQALRGSKKYYAIDNGFRTINTNTVDFASSFYLENLIYNELKSRQYDVFTGKTYNSEIDFVVVKNSKKCYVQVAYLLSDKRTIKREFGAFSSIKDASPKFVLSLDKVDMSHDGITHLNIIDFCLWKKDIFLT